MLNKLDQTHKDHRIFLLQQVQKFRDNEDAVAGLQIALNAWDRQYEVSRRYLVQEFQACEAAREQVRRQAQSFREMFVRPQSNL